MADILKTAFKPSVSGETLRAYEYAIDQQAFAFQLSVLTQDFTFFYVLSAQDTISSANPGTDLISLLPDRGSTLIDELISYNNTTIQAIHDSFQTYINNFKRPDRPDGEHSPPVGDPPLPVPQVYGWIQQLRNEVIAAVDKSACDAKALIKDLPNTPAQQAATEVWVGGLRVIAPAAQFSVQLAYTVVNPVPGLPSPKIQHGTAETIMAISGGLGSVGGISETELRVYISLAMQLLAFRDHLGGSPNIKVSRKNLAVQD